MTLRKQLEGLIEEQIKTVEFGSANELRIKLRNMYPWAQHEKYQYEIWRQVVRLKLARVKDEIENGNVK